MSKEIIVKRTPVPRALWYALAVLFTAYGVQRLFQQRYGAVVILLVLSGFCVFLASKERKKPQVILKISEEKLWTRHGGNKPWSSILCIRFRYEGTSQVYMDIYRSNEVIADEEINLHGVNISVWRLKRILKRCATVEHH